MDEKKKKDASYIMEFADEPVGIAKAPDKPERAGKETSVEIPEEPAAAAAGPVRPGRMEKRKAGRVKGQSDIKAAIHTGGKQEKAGPSGGKPQKPVASPYIWMQRLVRCVLFGFVFLFLLNAVSDVLVRKSLTEPWNMTLKVGGFFNEPENSVDVMFFGSSHMYCSVDPVQLETLTGQPAYILATQEQPVWVSYYYMKEALKTQRPHTVFFEVNMLVAEDDYAEEGTLYSAFDPIPLSFNKFQMINAAVPWGERRHYLFNIMKYHERWLELELEKDIIREFAQETDPYRGFVRLPSSEVVEERADISWVSDVGQPLDKSVEYLEKIIALSQAEGFRLVLLKSPSNATVEEQMLYNKAWETARREGVEYIDGNLLYEELGLNPEEDFYDQRHLNYIGAEKFTLYLGQYLK